MKQKTKIAITAIALFLLLLAWAPWPNNQEIRDKVFQERAHTDGTIDKQTGELICDYKVHWLPFGRHVASCEGSYFAAFWGQML